MLRILFPLISTSLFIVGQCSYDIHTCLWDLLRRCWKVSPPTWQVSGSLYQSHSLRSYCGFSERPPGLTQDGCERHFFNLLFLQLEEFSSSSWSNLKHNLSSITGDEKAGAACPAVSRLCNRHVIGPCEGPDERSSLLELSGMQRQTWWLKITWWEGMKWLINEYEDENNTLVADSKSVERLLIKWGFDSFRLTL